jgi:hypothetical protein
MRLNQLSDFMVSKIYSIPYILQCVTFTAISAACIEGGVQGLLLALKMLVLLEKCLAGKDCIMLDRVSAEASRRCPLPHLYSAWMSSC